MLKERLPEEEELASKKEILHSSINLSHYHIR